MNTILFFCRECAVALKGMNYISEQADYDVLGYFISKRDNYRRVEKFCNAKKIPVYFQTDDLLQRF